MFESDISLSRPSCRTEGPVWPQKGHTLHHAHMLYKENKIIIGYQSELPGLCMNYMRSTKVFQNSNNITSVVSIREFQNWKSNIECHFFVCGIEYNLRPTLLTGRGNFLGKDFLFGICCFKLISIFNIMFANLKWLTITVQVICGSFPKNHVLKICEESLSPKCH